MHLVETSLIKKYENDIGNSIVNVGGDVSYDLHWLPFLDNQISRQLISDSFLFIDEKIDERLDARGISQENVDSWNQAVVDLQDLTERVELLENSPAASITVNDIDIWNTSSKWQERN